METEEAEVQIGSERKKADEQIKYLGMVFDKNMKWKGQIQRLIKRIRSHILAIKQAAKYLTRSTMKMLIQAMIISPLRYGIGAWGQANLTEKRQLQRT